MHSRPGETPQESGRRFERVWASVLGVEPQRGSGNLWYAKLDVAAGSILFSLKWTSKKSFSITGDLMREAVRAITGAGGIGGETRPALAISVEGEEFIVMRASDLIPMLSSGETYFVPSRSEQKRARAKVPSLLREDTDG